MSETVEDYLNEHPYCHTIYDIENVADLSDYWTTASDFVQSKWELPLEKLSFKQGEWLEKIRDGIHDLKMKGRI